MICADLPASWHNRWFVPAVDLLSVVTWSPIVGVVGAGDPGSSRLVYAMVIGLVVVGVGLTVLAVWILRRTKPDLEVLAPLERMGDSDWKKRDPSTQRRMLDEVRPDGAEPLASEPPPPPIDADFEQADHPVASFSDLGPGLGGVAPDMAPGELVADEAGADPVDQDEPADQDDDAEDDPVDQDEPADQDDDAEDDPADQNDPDDDAEDEPADQDNPDDPADDPGDHSTETSADDVVPDPRG